MVQTKKKQKEIPKEENSEEPKKFKGRIKKGEIRNPNGGKNLPKGRQKGAKNHITKDIKEAFKKLIENNLENMEKWLEEVAEYNPERALRILIDISPYIVPKLATTEIKVEHKQQYDLTKLSDAELNELVKLSEKCSLSDNYQNQLITGGSEFLEKNDDINEH